MNTADRRQFILDRLETSGACSYEEFATALGVSTMTVRRDLGELVAQGAVIKTVGGVQKAAAPSYLYETALHSRLALRRLEKRAIARLALDLVAPGSTIFLDGSSTCLELARALAKGKQGLTIVTNSALACLELGENGGNTIVGIGGQYDANSLSFVGPQAEDWAKTLFVDTAFVGTKGLIPAKGTFESSCPPSASSRSSPASAAGSCCSRTIPSLASAGSARSSTSGRSTPSSPMTGPRAPTSPSSGRKSHPSSLRPCAAPD